MKRNEFENVINTFKKYYGKELDRELEEIYFSEMKYYNGDMSEYIKKVCDTYSFFPKVAELKTINQELREKTTTININQKICDCELCDGTGYRFINQQKNKGHACVYAVACDCENGDNKLYDGRALKDTRYRSNYIVPRYREIMPF